ncbi:MAG: 6-bladed beta-propeller, partial [Candidatus Aminicenantes bacterium]|nr:6-bladed beta-propeller [Candidatus Aminicenantes bacterium]
MLGKMIYFKFNRRLFLTIFFCSFLLISCSNKNKQNIIVGEKEFLIKDFQIDNIFDIGHIEKIIKLEVSDDSLFAFANRVRIDKNGCIFLLDEHPQQSLFRFDQKGKFLNRYGRRGQGPGEYQTIRGFDFDSMGNVYLLTVYKIIKYKKTGEFLKERKIDILSGGIKIIRDELFLGVIRDRSKGLHNKSSVYVYNT